MSKTALSTSQNGGEGFIKKRTTVIQRGGPVTNLSASYGRSYSSMGFGGLSLAPGTYATMSHDGVSDMKGKREHEKKEMQNLNERLGSYIEKVRFLEASVAQLEQELEFYRNQKAADFKPIRDMYENELSQARTVIDELSAEKGSYEAKVAGLQDLVDTLKHQINTFQGDCTEYRTQIDDQTSQIGGFEGELSTLRMKIQNMKNEHDKLRNLSKDRLEENRRLRADLDGETAAHIEADCASSTLEEQVEFLTVLLDKMPSESKQPVKIKGLDLDVFWQNSMSTAIRDIQDEYENKLDLIRQDMETRFNAQIRQVQSGAVRDSLENKTFKEESKKLKSHLDASNSQYSELEVRNVALQAECINFRCMIKSLENDLEEEKSGHLQSKGRLQAELETCMEELRMVIDAKLSLEMEISCYRQLLEGEENRMNISQSIGQAMGLQSKGSSELNSIVNIRSSSSSSSPTSKSSTMSSNSGNVTKATTATKSSSSCH